jgi:biotin carboxyl carrier protein
MQLNCAVTAQKMGRRGGQSAGGSQESRETGGLDRNARRGEHAIVTTIRVPKTGGLPATKVNVVRWLKREGETVKRGEAIVELETEKVNYELDSPAEGKLLKIVAKEGAAVPIGDAVCHIGEPGEAIPEV